MNRIVSLFKNTALLVVILIVVLSFKGEKDALHNRVFNISLSETKNDVVSKKVIADVIYFKDGKIYSEFLDEKFGYKWFRYRINRDTMFVDSTDTEVRMLEVEASVTNADDQTVNMTFVQQEWDIDGVIKITKKDKLKKYFDFAGREKGGMPKKEKKKKKKIIEVIPPGEEARKDSVPITPPKEQ